MFQPLQLLRPFSGNAEWKRFYREGDGFQRPKRTAREGKTPTKKRKSNLCAPCLIFIHTQAFPLRPLPLPFLSLPLLSLPSQSGPLLPIPFPFSLSSQLASSHLQPHLLYLLRPGEGGNTRPRWSLLPENSCN